MIFNKLLGSRQESKDFSTRFISLLALHLALYAAIRLLFYYWNYKLLSSLTLSEVILSFLAGVRFDLAIAGPICALVMLTALWIPQKAKYLLILPLLLFQMGLMMISVMDSELASYVGRRFTVNSLYMLGEGGAQSVLAYYPLIIFTFFLVLAYFYFSFKITLIPQKFLIRVRVAMTFLLVAFIIIFGRGGLQEKPISFINSKIINHPFAHQLVLNSAFTFVKSIGREHVERIQFFDQDTVISYLNLDPKLYSKTEITPQKINIIILMLESLSAEYVNEKYTPFFHELSQKGVLFSPAYANGRRSVEGMAAVMTGVPSLMEESFINSEFANQFTGLGTLLKTKGYHTSFFHGAQNGSMRFEAFTPAMGFDHYFGKREFNDNTLDDGAWGIFDDPFLKWTCDKITDFPEQFATVIFTLTAHVPYPLPKDYQPPPAFKDEPQMIRSIHYADGALKNFFTCAQTKPWFKNTMFVLLGDHTGPSLKTDASFKSKFEIPILFYTENSEKLKNLNNQQLAQQIDLLPTLTDFVGVKLDKKNHLARSLFDPGKKSIALFSDQKYEMAGDGDTSENALKAFRQYFSQGLYENRLYR